MPAPLKDLRFGSNHRSAEQFWNFSNAAEYSSGGFLDDVGCARGMEDASDKTTSST
jgi:hypothetical protein